jgi:anti-anti-sigma factor
MTALAGAATVRVSDEQGDERLPDLRWVLHDLVLTGVSRVIVDVSRVERLSSATLAALLNVHRRCRARGGGVVIRGGNRATADLLYRNGLHRVFEIEEPSPARHDTARPGPT